MSNGLGGSSRPTGPYRPIEPPSPWKLLLMFVLVLVAIWYLSTQS